jgi:hypothetical protein
MNRMQSIVTALLLASAGGTMIACQSLRRETVSESHIRANVPDFEDFDRLFKLGLEKFFHDPGKVVTVDYELLQPTPTQVAVSSPKFYAWVKVYENGAFLEEGAVRVGAVEKKEFVVINYLPREEIEQDKQRMNYLFPKTAIGRINEKMGK